MSVIDTKQGAIKISEVAVDQAQGVFGTAILEDAQTLVTQVSKVMINALRKTSLNLTSDGDVIWNGTIITNNGQNVFLKLNQNSAAGVVTITLPTALLSTFTLANNEILYFKASRSALTSSFTAVAANLAVATELNMPALSAPQNDALDDPTLYVPLYARHDLGANQALWWIPSGIYWSQSNQGIVGSSTSESNFIGIVILSPAGNGDATTLAAAIALIPAYGGQIILADDITVNTAETIPMNTKLSGIEKAAKMTLGASGSVIFANERCKLEDIWISTTQNITMVDVNGGNFFNAENCRLECPPAGTAIGIRIRANGTHIETCEFNGVTGGSTSTGIQYDAGYGENSEAFNIGTT